MSTKIYNGYVLKDMNILELRQFALKVKTLIEPEIQNSVNRIGAEMFSTSYDFKQFGLINDYLKDNENKPVKLSRFYWYLKNRYDKVRKTNIADPAVDFSFSFTVIPIEDKLLALLYTERNEFIKIWENLPEVDDYHYQNQTDEPDHISEEDWNTRKTDWDLALPRYSTPSENGFTFDPFYLLPRLENDKVLEIIQHFNKRSRAIKVVRELMWKDYQEKSEISNPSDFFTFFKLLSTDLKNEYENKIEEVQNQLIDFTSDVL